MPSLDTVNMDSLFTLLKGEPGLRKSTCALSYPTPQYWFDTDQKMQALVLPMKKWGIDATQVHYDSYTDWDKVKNKLESFRVTCPYKTVIIDSITSSADTMTRQVKKSKVNTPQGKTIGGIPVSGLEEFNAESSAFQEMIALLKDIQEYHKIHIIMIAHVIGQRKDSDSNKLTHHSRIIATGAEKISAKLAAYMTEVYHFNIKAAFSADQEGTYGLLTKHTGNDYARTSLPLPTTIEFGDEPLYERHIKPAIEKLKAEIPIVRNIPIINQPPNRNFNQGY